METIKVKLLDKLAKLPTKSYERAAAFDFYTPYSFKIGAGETLKVPLGIAVEIPPNYCLYFIGRSGLSSMGIVKLGGLIDSDYRGELAVILYNASGQDGAIEAGYKIVQGIILPVLEFKMKKEDVLSDTERGEKGFGSSDNKG